MVSTNPTKISYVLNMRNVPNLSPYSKLRAVGPVSATVHSINSIKTGLECEINIQQVIQMLQSQRSDMVYTLTQYKFVYMVIKEYAQKIQVKKVC